MYNKKVSTKNKGHNMENTKDYNFFYINDKEDLPLKVIITASLGEGKYNREEIEKLIQTIENKNTQGKIHLYQDDGESFYNVSYNNNNEKLDIGTKEDNFEKWNIIKDKALVVEIEDLLVFAQSSDSKVVKKYKIK